MTVAYWAIQLDGGPHATEPQLTVYAEIGEIGDQHDVVSGPMADVGGGAEAADRLLDGWGWLRTHPWRELEDGRTAPVMPTRDDALVGGVLHARSELEEAQERLREAVLAADTRRRAALAAGVQGAPAQAAIAAAAGLRSRQTVENWAKAAATA